MVKSKNNNTTKIIIGIAILLILGLLVAVFIVGSTKKIADIKTTDYVGKKVTVKGTVENTVKIGSLSGYTLADESGKISVSSQNLPEEGETIRVSGTLIKDTLLGYYIQAD
jgi:cytochrome oxidase Cu insertion factor (SCO1/SenC/PrrC family)